MIELEQRKFNLAVWQAHDAKARFSELLETIISATFSPATVRSLRNLIFAPISIRVVKSPIRRGLIQIFRNVRLEFLHMSAATMRKAADEGSTGTTIGRGFRSGRPSSMILRPCSPKGSERNSAPK